MFSCSRTILYGRWTYEPNFLDDTNKVIIITSIKENEFEAKQRFVWLVLGWVPDKPCALELQDGQTNLWANAAPGFNYPELHGPIVAGLGLCLTLVAIQCSVYGVVLRQMLSDTWWLCRTPLTRSIRILAQRYPSDTRKWQWYAFGEHERCILS